MFSIPRILLPLLASTVLALPTVAEPAMWTLKDADTTINIFGTVHLLPEGTDWKGARVKAAIEAADSICFEVDVEGRALEALGLTFNHGVIKDGSRLTDKIDKDQEKELRETAAFLNIPFPSLNAMQPWFAAMTIGEYAYDRMGLGEGVEFSLYPEIRASGKTLCEMETLDEQMGSLWRMPVEAQLDMLFEDTGDADDKSIEVQLADDEKLLLDLIENWLAGDVSAISEDIDEEAEANRTFHEALLVSRNQNWVPRIEEMLAREGGNIFIAVGAAHLAGKDSVIKMLRDKGYKIDGP